MAMMLGTFSKQPIRFDSKSLPHEFVAGQHCLLPVQYLKSCFLRLHLLYPQCFRSFQSNH